MTYIKPLPTLHSLIIEHSCSNRIMLWYTHTGFRLFIYLFPTLYHINYQHINIFKIMCSRDYITLPSFERQLELLITNSDICVNFTVSITLSTALEKTFLPLFHCWVAYTLTGFFPPIIKVSQPSKHETLGQRLMFAGKYCDRMCTIPTRMTRHLLKFR